ncbi:MKRN2 opposite strand protein-like [Scylla paramamosain]|uniref:MKRN2 opposite strand protein-like n=1 Tax=Scylla paramamosain TaxID=85552 RepID=UPI0030836568
MNLDPGIVCFQHCEGRFFCFTLPSRCPMCGADLTTQPLASPPFRVPYPFVRASQAPCCLVIKPTRGDFLHDYRSSQDLHIGVTDSEGQVYEYDCEGLHNDYTASWTQALAVPIIRDPTAPDRLDAVWKEYWNFSLHTLAEDSAWTSERYSEDSHNCYSFVLAFLQALAPPGLEVKGLTKTSLCARLLLPHTAPAARYISLYRKIKKDGHLSAPRLP